MVFLLVDGDYFLSGFKPNSDADVKTAVEKLEDVVMAQLQGGASLRIDFRVVFFSSAMIASLAEAQRTTLISSLRRLRFQTAVLESVRGRSGSPIDSALCTRAITFAMMPSQVGPESSSHGGSRPVFCFVTPNAYIASALELLISRGSDVVFAVYDGDDVAEELLGYISAAYGTGIATLAKEEGISFVPNTEAASAALAAIQREGKDLPLAVLMQLKNMETSLTKRDNGSESPTASVIASRKKVQDEQQLFRPPPIPGLPDPFEQDKSVIPPPMEEAKAVEPPQPHEGDSVPAHQAKASEVPPPFMGAPIATVSTATSPSAVVAAAVPPLTEPPASACEAVNHPPRGVTAEPDVRTSLQGGWALLFDAKRRRHYYAFTDSQGRTRATWQHPLGEAKQAELDKDVEAWYATQQSPARAASPGALPAGWEERLDPSSGRKFYVNHNTRETSWEPPTKVASPLLQGPAAANKTQSPEVSTAQEPLPENWEQRTDPVSGRVYYVNHTTHTTSWTRPARVAAPAPAPAPAAVAPSAPVAQPSDTSSASAWEERVDQASGKVYYVNHKTRQTSWTKPSVQHKAESSEWEPRTDAASGRTYYFNPRTRETAWSIPTSK